MQLREADIISKGVEYFVKTVNHYKITTIALEKFNIFARASREATPLCANKHSLQNILKNSSTQSKDQYRSLNIWDVLTRVSHVWGSNVRNGIK